MERMRSERKGKGWEVREMEKDEKWEKKKG